MVLSGCHKTEIKNNGCTCSIIGTTINAIIPNVFTPNGDGVNDLWQIMADTNVIDFNLKIKRGSKVIFETNTPNIGWDGTENLKPSRIGKYKYTLELDVVGTNSDHQIIEGCFHLIRETTTLDHCQDCVTPSGNDPTISCQ